MVQDVLGPRAGEESQNCVWRKWPLGWLRQHVLISRGGGNGQDIDGGLGHEVWDWYWETGIMVRVSGGGVNKGERLSREEKRGSLYSEPSMVR
jgi:hypothetical protein